MSRLFAIAVISAVLALSPATSDASLHLPKWPRHKTVAEKPVKPSAKERKRIERDVQRLESLLSGVNSSANVSDASWKKVTAEATELASRIHTNVKSSTNEKKALRAADDLRRHVAKMSKEVAQRDYRGGRRYAKRALGAATKLDEWAG